MVAGGTPLLSCEAEKELHTERQWEELEREAFLCRMLRPRRRVSKTVVEDVTQAAMHAFANAMRERPRRSVRIEAARGVEVLYFEHLPEET